MDFEYLSQFIDVTDLELVSLKQFFDATGLDLYYSLPALLEKIETVCRLTGASSEVISQEMKKYEKILRDISITAHEAPSEQQLKPKCVR
jgi:hypothetical protein